MRGRWHIAGAIGLLLILGFGITTAKVARAAGSPPTLDGEVLSTSTWSNVASSCGTESSASFTVTGTASGPYAGPLHGDHAGHLGRDGDGHKPVWNICDRFADGSSVRNDRTRDGR